MVRGKSGRARAPAGVVNDDQGSSARLQRGFQEDKEALFDAFRTTRDCVEAMAILFEEGLDFSGAPQ